MEESEKPGAIDDVNDAPCAFPDTMHVVGPANPDTTHVDGPASAEPAQAVGLDGAGSAAADITGLSYNYDTPKSAQDLMDLADAAGTRFKQSDSSEDLDQCIELHQEMLSLQSLEPLRRSMELEHLATYLHTRFERGANPEELDEAIDLYRQSHMIAPDQVGDDARADCLSRLGNCLLIRFRMRKALEDLDEAICWQCEAVAICPIASPLLPVCMNNLSMMFMTSFTSRSADMDMDESITLLHDLRTIWDRSTPYHVKVLHDLAFCLSHRFGLYSADDDLDECISVHRDLIGILSAEHPERVKFFLTLVLFLNDRFTRKGAREDLDEIIDLLRTDLSASPSDLRLQIRFTNRLNKRFALFNEERDLEELLEIYRQILPALPEDHPELMTCANGFARSVHLDYLRRGTLQFTDMDSAISYLRRALRSPQNNFATRQMAITTLATCLMDRSRDNDKEKDLDEAIQLRCEAFKACSPSDPDLPSYMYDLSNTLLYTYQYRGSTQDDFSIALRLQREAIKRQSLNDPNRPTFLAGLARSLKAQYKLGWAGEEVLDESVRLHREALDLVPEQHADRHRHLDGLASALMERFDYRGDVQDFNEMAHLSMQALQSCPRNHGLYVEYLGKLADVPGRRLNRLGGPHYQQEMDGVITMHRDALNMLDPGDSSRPLHLIKLAISLSHAYRQGQRNALDECIELYKEAVSLLAEDNSDRIVCQINLASQLSQRYLVSEDEHDAEQSLQYYTKALLACTPGQALRSHILLGLSLVFSLRGSTNYDLASSLDYLSDGLQESAYGAYKRLVLAQQTLKSLAWRKADLSPAPPELLVEAYKKVMGILPEVLLLADTTRKQLTELRRADNLASDAAVHAIWSNQPDIAVEFLENGRAVIWAQALGLRIDPDTVPSHYRDDFRFLCHALSSPAQIDAHADDEFVQRRQQRSRFAALVEKVRAEPGRDRFLLPDSFIRLSQAASQGPVAILASGHAACHALIISGPVMAHSLRLEISTERLKQLALSIRTANDDLGNHLRNDQKVAASVLPDHDLCEHSSETKLLLAFKELWELVVRPILEQLDYVRAVPPNKRPRIWWCPSGRFTFLPIHAAGIYGKETNEENRVEECCSDFVVSSYIPTLSALLRARKDHQTVRCQEARLMLAAVPEAYKDTQVQWDFLHGAQREVTAVKNAVPESLIMNLPADEDTSLDHGAGVTKATVLDGLGRATLLHLACHGHQDPQDALGSGFAMRDGLLTIENLMLAQSKTAFLAFLSACETAKGDDQQPDQAVHLAAAMLFVGFKSVVGTMWSIGDLYTPLVARAFYRRLFRGDKETLDPNVIPYALDAAVRDLRKKVSHPGVWAPYIHLGM